MYTRIIMIVLGLWSAMASYTASAEADCLPSTPVRVVKLGMSTALSGPGQHLGLAMLKGVQRRLAEENCQAFWRTQGIRFDLKVLDDSYDPEVAADNATELIVQEHVIALVGNVGTPTAERAWKIADNAQVIYYGAYTGANILRLTPPAPFVFNYRASYDQEMKTIVDEVIARGIPVKRIALFLQNDAFGNAGLAATTKALGEICNDCARNIFEMRYERNTLNISDALKAFIERSPKPKAVILVGATESSAKFIHFAHPMSPSTLFYSLSFTGATALAQQLGDTSAQVYMSQVVPAVSTEGGLNGAVGFNEVAREGYLATEVLFKALRSIRGDINSEALRQSLLNIERQLNVAEDLHNMPVNTGAIVAADVTKETSWQEDTVSYTVVKEKTVDQQIMDFVWLAKLKQNKSNTGLQP